MADGYDPRKSKVSTETMEAWRSAPVNGDLIEVPGIGPAAIRALVGDDDMDGLDRIVNTHQLIGQYLMLKGPNNEDGSTVTPEQLNHKFWFFLKNRGIVSHRSAIVLAINEKVGTFFPGIYDANAEEEDDDE